MLLKGIKIEVANMDSHQKNELEAVISIVLSSTIEELLARGITPEQTLDYIPALFERINGKLNDRITDQKLKIMFNAQDK